MRPMSAGGCTAPWAALLPAFSSCCPARSSGWLQHRLRPFRPCAACRGGVYRHQGRRAGDRHRGPAPGGPARAAPPLRLGNCRSGVCGYLLLRGAISFGHRQRRAVGLSPCGHASRGSVASASRSRFRAALGNLAHREPVACALDRSPAPGHFRIRARPRHHRHLPLLFQARATAKAGSPDSALACLEPRSRSGRRLRPAFWIFVGAPYIERLSRSPRLAGALAASPPPWSASF